MKGHPRWQHLEQRAKAEGMRFWNTLAPPIVLSIHRAVRVHQTHLTPPETLIKWSLDFWRTASGDVLCGSPSSYFVQAQSRLRCQ